MSKRTRPSSPTDEQKRYMAFAAAALPSVSRRRTPRPSQPPTKGVPRRTEGDLEIVSWTGRTSPVTGVRPPTQYTIGDKSNSPMFNSISDAQKARADNVIGKLRNTPTPELTNIMATLGNMKEEGTWGGKRRRRASRRTRRTRKSRRAKTTKRRRIKKSRKTTSSRRSRRRSRRRSTRTK